MSPTVPDPFEEVRAECIRLYEAGEPIDHAAFLLRLAPERREEFLHFLDGLQAVDRVVEANPELSPGRNPSPEPDWRPQEVGRPDGPLYVLGAEVTVPGGLGVVFYTTATTADGRKITAVVKICHGPPDVVRPAECRINDIRTLPEHENLLRILDSGRDPRIGFAFFYVAEHIEGRDLGEILASRDAQQYQDDPRLAADLIRQAARGVSALHGLVHRDLKPRNILVARDGKVKVIDLDHSSRPGDQAIQVLTEPYASPEQILDLGWSEASDVYSFGVILFELLTGQRLVTARTHHGRIHQIREVVPPLVNTLNLKVPKDLALVVARALAKDAKDRYPNASELADDLQRFIAGQKTEAARAADKAGEGRTMRAVRWLARHWQLVVALLAICLLLGYVLLQAWLSQRAFEIAIAEEAGLVDASLARMVAGNVLFQLNQFSVVVTELSQNDEFHSVWKQQDPAALKGHLQKVLQHANEDPRITSAQGRAPPIFASINVMNAQGRILAVTPDHLAEWMFVGRNYFQGAMRNKDLRPTAAVHVSWIYRSRNIIGREMFALSIPFWVESKPGQTPDGVIVTTLTTQTTLGLLSLSNNNRKVALVLPYEGRDHDPSVAPVSSEPAEYRILLHPAYRGQAGVPTGKYPLAGRQFPKRRPGPELWVQQEEQHLPPDLAYHDPVSDDDGPIKGDPDYAGRWIAGFAQVGNTEMMVVVQQKYNNAISTSAGWSWLSGGYAVGVPLAAALLAIWAVRSVYRSGRRNHPAR